MSKKLVGKAKARARKKNCVPAVKPKKVGKEFRIEDIFNFVPTMIHEDKYVPMDCVLCGSEMKTIHDTHNPSPITEKCYAKEAFETGNPNRCCSECNSTKVNPARLRDLGMKVDSVCDLSSSVTTKVRVEKVPVSELMKMKSWEDAA